MPDLLGVGLLTDGDGTNSHSMADYADFVIVRCPEGAARRAW